MEVNVRVQQRQQQPARAAHDLEDRAVVAGQPLEIPIDLRLRGEWLVGIVELRAERTVSGHSGLLPGQSLRSPPRQRVAMMIVVERTLETFQHVVDLGESGLLQCLARRHRALPAAADEDDGAVHAGYLAHLADEMRIDVPVWAVVPGDVCAPTGRPTNRTSISLRQSMNTACGCRGEKLEVLAGIRCSMHRNLALYPERSIVAAYAEADKLQSVTSHPFRHPNRRSRCNPTAPKSSPPSCPAGFSSSTVRWAR